MTDTPVVEGDKPPRRPVDWDAVRRWATSGAVVVGAVSLVYSAWLLTDVAREVRYGPDLDEVTAGLDRVEASVTRASRDASTAATPARSGYETMFDKDEGDIVDAIEAQTRAIRSEGDATRSVLRYR